MCENNNSCLANTLENIILLQQSNNNSTLGCNRPFLENILQTANTRPINLYSCCTNALWEIPYDFNGITGVSSFFRIESINDNCAIFRILILNDDGSYTSTNNFFTINLNCVGSIKCLGDVLVNNL